MSLIFLVAAAYMAKANIIGISMDFLIAWALFSIAAAIWIGRCKK